MQGLLELHVEDLIERVTKAQFGNWDAREYLIDELKDGNHQDVGAIIREVIVTQKLSAEEAGLFALTVMSYLASYVTLGEMTDVYRGYETGLTAYEESERDKCNRQGIQSA